MIKLSIPQVIRTRADKTSLGVSPRELETELIRLYQENDTAGCLDLFEAYKDQELKYREEKSVQATIHLAKMNLDFICEIADVKLSNKEERSSARSIRKAALTPQNKYTIIGPIRNFYRRIVDYNPFDQTMN